MIEIFFKMAHENSPSTKDLLIAIQEIWPHFDKEYFFKLVGSVPERIKAIIKTQREITRYSNFFVLKLKFFSQHWIMIFYSEMFSKNYTIDLNDLI